MDIESKLVEIRQEFGEKFAELDRREESLRNDESVHALARVGRLDALSAERRRLQQQQRIAEHLAKPSSSGIPRVRFLPSSFEVRDQ